MYVQVYIGISCRARAQGYNTCTRSLRKINDNYIVNVYKTSVDVCTLL